MEKTIKIGMLQTWEGKPVCSLKRSEREAMEAALRSKTTCKLGFDYIPDPNKTSKVEDIDLPHPPAIETRESEVKSKPKETTRKSTSNCSITIGGKHYNSWDEVIADNNPHVKVVSGGGNTITIGGGRVVIGGTSIINYDESREVIHLIVQGSAGDIEVDRGTVDIQGNARNVSTNHGSVNCQNVDGNVTVSHGSVNAGYIKGSASVAHGSINKS